MTTEKPKLKPFPENEMRSEGAKVQFPSSKLYGESISGSILEQIIYYFSPPKIKKRINESKLICEKVLSDLKTYPIQEWRGPDCHSVAAKHSKVNYSIWFSGIITPAVEIDGVNVLTKFDQKRIRREWERQEKELEALEEEEKQKEVKTKFLSAE